MASLGNVRRDLKKAYQEAAGQGGWREVGRRFGISGGMAFRIARRRYEPKDAKIRTRLGLPARVEVAACPKCGEAHLKQGCTKEVSLHRDLFAMSVEELRWRLERREICGQAANEDDEETDRADAVVVYNGRPDRNPNEEEI